MSFTSYADIIDPQVIVKLIGQEWLNEARMIMSGIIKRDIRPNKGTLISEIRQSRFQDSSGQAVAAGNSISSSKKSQTECKHPIIWRYASADDPDVITEIEEKDVPRENADIASDIKKAALEYLDDSIVAVIKGTGAALTGNQAGTGTTVSLDNIVDGKASLDDRGIDLDGGAMAMRSEVYWKMVKLGLVAATSNTFGNALQEAMVLSGRLPVNALGLTPIISNKFESLGSNKYYMYLIGAAALILRGNDAPVVETAKGTANAKFSTITNFKISYGLGFDGVTWGVAGKETVNDTELATSGNWTLAAAYENQVKIARVYTASA